MLNKGTTHSQIVLDRWSFASVCVVPYSYACPIGAASGFIVATRSKRYYLITNYHVVSGINPDTESVLSEDGHLPDRIMIALPHWPEAGVNLVWRPHVQHLFDADGKPFWVEHPRFGRAFDVVALPLQIVPELSRAAIVTDDWDDIAIFPSSTVSIVGFPHGLSGPRLTAIWKTGAVASEPDLGDEPDFFWIDANTRKGMSGSPVIARRFGPYVRSSGETVVGSARADRLLGVYAGRASEAADMTLGRVWRWRGVVELLTLADSLMAGGALRPLVGQIEHFVEPGSKMRRIKNEQFQIIHTGIPGTVPVTTAQLLREFVSLDQRFGVSLERLKLAAKVIAACEAASASGTIDLSPEQAQLLAECIRNPQGWFFQAPLRGIADRIEQICNELEGTSSTNEVT